MIRRDRVSRTTKIKRRIKTVVVEDYLRFFVRRLGVVVNGRRSFPVAILNDGCGLGDGRVRKRTDGRKRYWNGIRGVDLFSDSR